MKKQQNIQIKARFTNTILFEGSYESTKVAIVEAVNKKADLYGADLYGADLRGADLGGEKLIINPIQILGLRWFVLITPEYLTIGCKRYTHEEWKKFKRTEITPMADKAWDWWKAHKDMLFAACELHRAEAKKAERK